MSSNDQPVTFWGAVIMLWLLVVISAVAAVPMVVGVVGVALVPGVGELRSHDPWLWLNLLWMFPAFWIITTVINAFLTALLVIGIFRRIDDVFEDLLIWLSVALLFTTFFQSLLAALMASLISRTHEIPARLVGEAPSEKERKSGTRSRRGKRLVTA